MFATNTKALRYIYTLRPRVMSTSAASGSGVINHWDFLSTLSKNREQSPTRALMPFMKIPGMINLGTGLPNAKYFPFRALNFTLEDGTELALTPEELNEALQYSATPGLPKLLTHLKQITASEHAPPYADWDLCVTTGSQDGLTKAFEMLLNPGDIVIVEAPTYSGTLAFLKPLGVNFLPIVVDEEGICPKALETALAGLTPEQRAKCRVVYTIPTGQNPSGARASNQRKVDVYNVCRKYNMLIIEDDPYWAIDFIDFDTKKPELFKNRHSYMHIDTDQRVLRFDSASKVLSSGLRMGWVSGPKTLIERLCLTTQATTLHASGVSQAMVAKLLEHWGLDGWKNQMETARSGYFERREWMIEAIQQELGDLVEYNVPAAGMFVWIKIKECKISAKELIEKKAVDSKVLFLAGEAFITPQELNITGKDGLEGAYVRASYSVASKEQMREAMKRFCIMLEEEA